MKVKEWKKWKHGNDNDNDFLHKALEACKSELRRAGVRDIEYSISGFNRASYTGRTNEEIFYCEVCTKSLVEWYMVVAKEFYQANQ